MKIKVIVASLIILLLVSPVFASEIQVGESTFTLTKNYPNSHFINENYYTNDLFSIRKCQSLDYIFGHRANENLTPYKIGNHDVIKLYDENQTFLFFSVNSKFYCINGTNITDDITEIINTSAPSEYTTDEFLTVFIQACNNYISKDNMHIYKNSFLVKYEENCQVDHNLLAIKNFFESIFSKFL